MGFLWIFKPLLVRACLPSKLKIFRSLVGKSYPKVDFIFPITELLTIGKIELFTCLLFSRWAVIKKQELYIGTMQSRSFFFILLLLYTFYYPHYVLSAWKANPQTFATWKRRSRGHYHENNIQNDNSLFQKKNKWLSKYCPQSIVTSLRIWVTLTRVQRKQK